MIVNRGHKLHEVTITGLATAEMQVETVEDLRTLVAWLNKYNVPNDTDVDMSLSTVFVDLTGDGVAAQWIECGDHIPPANAYDVLIPTHGHGDPDKAPARFDWPAKDKTSSTWDEDDEDILCHFFRKHDDDNTYHRLHGNYYCTKCYARREDRYGDEDRPE